MTTIGSGAQPLTRPTGIGKALRDLLPLAIGLIVLGAIEWVLVTQGWLLGTWILAGFLAVHGLIHCMFLAPATATAAGGAAYPFDPARSWLVTRLGLAAGAARGLAAAFALLVATGFVLAGLATIGLVVPTDWWGMLVVGSSLLSIVLLVLVASPSLVLGIAVDLVLLGLVWAGAWTPTA